MYEKPSLGTPVSKFRILLKIRHILWPKNRPSRAVLLPLPLSKKCTPEVHTATVPPSNICGRRLRRAKRDCVRVSLAIAARS